MNGRFLLILASMTVAAHAASVERALDLGRSARADGVPQAALHDLREALEQAEGEEKAAVAIELARCLIDADRGVESVAVLENLPPSDATTFWLAQAQAEAGNYAGALKNYSKLSGKGEYLTNARYGRARMLEALGRIPQAIEAYDAVGGRWRNAASLDAAMLLIADGKLDAAAAHLAAVKAPNRRDGDTLRYLKGRLALEKGDLPDADAAFGDFEPRNRRLVAGAVIGEADRLLRNNQPDQAVAQLEAFVEDNPRTPELGEVIAKLDEAKSRANDPSNAALKRWENDDAHAARAALATFYLARSDERNGRNDRAMRTYEEFLAMHPDHALRSEATIRLVRMQLADHQLERAVRTLEGSELAASDSAERGRLRYLRAATHYLAGNFASAATHFEQAAEYNPELTPAARANAALCAMLAGNEPLAERLLDQLRDGDPAIAERLELERAFLSARRGNPDAGEELSWLAEKAPTVASRDRAGLALAEWRWRANDPEGARSAFQRVSNAVGDGRKDYFSVFLADDGSQDAAARVEAAAKAFLAENPDSEHESEVLMKWGEVLARVGDHRSARVQFENAARSATDPKLADTALFLAARSAARSMEPAQLEAAVLLFDEVAQARDSSLATQARLEQAALLSALNRPEDAVSLLDNLIETETDPRTRFAALLKKGETLFSVGDEAHLKASVEVFQEVSADENALPAERNEALTRMATANEKLGEFDAALSSYYEVLNAPRDQQPEYFWYYKAGFDAARLLRDRDRFKEAAAIYEKMAAVEGPRAEEAGQEVKRLRLQNFIWED